MRKKRQIWNIKSFFLEMGAHRILRTLSALASLSRIPYRYLANSGWELVAKIIAPQTKNAK